MKRLLGTIGLTYLSSLAVVFYFSDSIVAVSLTVLSLFTISAGIILKILRRKIKIKSEVSSLMIVLAAVSLAACVSMFVYTNAVYSPVVDNYSDKEITINGYVCDKIQVKESSNLYTIAVTQINGKKENFKINLTSVSDLQIEEFDCIKAKLNTTKVDEGYLMSRKIFLTSYYDISENSIEPTGEKQQSIYSIAVGVRKAMERSLDVILPEGTASLSKAVLLGDKQSLQSDVKDDFSKTGTTFLIVVSGLHLSIITAFVLLLLKNAVKNRFVVCIILSIVVLCFASVTGFAPSVVRSGVMAVMTYCSKALLRRSDGINSLGAAAIVLTVFNPFAVGDIGMILSFSATLGIILWAKKIEFYILRKLNISNRYIYRIVKSVVSLVSVSAAASLCIIPITTVAFNTISPFVVISSLFLEPIVSVLLVCAMLTAIFNLIPFVSFLAYPFALIAALAGRLFLFIISFFASLPYSVVNSDKPYFYVWFILSFLLVVVGYAVKAKGFYVRYSAALSAVVLVFGWAVYSVIGYGTVTLSVYSVGSGVSAAVKCGSNISFISCGGSTRSAYGIIQDVYGDYSSVDSVIVPNTKLKYSRYIPQLLSEVDISNILLYDSSDDKAKRLEDYDGISRNTFGDNCSFTVNLNSKSSVDVINIDSVTYQYVNINGSTLLFVPSEADIANLPEKYRKADYLLIDSVPENSGLLHCDSVIFSGLQSTLDKEYYSIKQISDTIYSTADDTVEFVFSGG